MQLEDISEKIRNFRDARDWKQFHNPKDMAIALSIEVSELLEHFLWKSPEQVEIRIETKREEIESEIADIGIYLTELADNLGIDLLAAMEKKIKINAVKYPVEQVRGSSKKYSEYTDPQETDL
jgi:NTP pyrophosphatase (non-canonical NTP hydrolase)